VRNTAECLFDSNAQYGILKKFDDRITIMTISLQEVRSEDWLSFLLFQDQHPQVRLQSTAFCRTVKSWLSKVF
jgi:hypothetical protein